MSVKIDLLLDIGGRLPHEIKTRLRDMIDTGVSVPSLSYYVQCVHTETS